MYSETDLVVVKKQLKNTIILTVILALVFLIPALAFLLRKPQWMGAAFLSIGVCGIIFLWGVYGALVFNYYRFIRDILQGRKRETKGEVVEVASEPVYKDNRLLYYEILVHEEGEEDIDRILLYDNNKGKPEFEKGKKYSFRTFQNFIVNWEPL